VQAERQQIHLLTTQTPCSQPSDEWKFVHDMMCVCIAMNMKKQPATKSGVAKWGQAQWCETRQAFCCTRGAVQVGRSGTRNLGYNEPPFQL